MATSLWSRLMYAWRAGTTAFREAYLSGMPDDAGDFDSYAGRVLRYELLWALYDNTIYSDIHKWSKKFRADLGLYAYIRSIYNPSYRLTEFHVSHLMGGALDPDAGDGDAIPSALPILTDHEPLRPAISQLWQWSNWPFQKDLWTRYGTVYGDAGLEVVDDVIRQKVYLKVVKPKLLYDVTFDPFGNVKGYERVEVRPHPDGTQTDVVYREVVTRDGDNVVYQTYLDDRAYAWSDKGAEWAEPYGFVPLVLVQHINVGLDWGWSELLPGLGKIREVDDLASKLHDQIRKSVDVQWFFSGVAAPKTTPTTTRSAATPENPQGGREEAGAFYASDPNAKATPMVANLNIADAGARIDALLKELERDYPELQMDIWTASGDASGRALRVARQRAETKIQQRRAAYDDALVRAQQMAVAIGGMRGYDGFAGFGLDSYAATLLDHSIGERGVFASDPVDKLEEDQLFWQNADAAIKAGLPLTVYLKRNGWSEADIADVVRLKASAALVITPPDTVPPSGGT